MFPRAIQKSLTQLKFQFIFKVHHTSKEKIDIFLSSLFFGLLFLISFHLRAQHFDWFTFKVIDEPPIGYV